MTDRKRVYANFSPSMAQTTMCSSPRNTTPSPSHNLRSRLRQLDASESQDSTITSQKRTRRVSVIKPDQVIHHGKRIRIQNAIEE